MTRRAGRIVVLIILLLVAGAWSPPARAEVGFDFFYSNLSPHGTWLVSARYGRVWQPDVYAEGWNPYYDGRWVYSEVGWTWVSDYEWGAIPYHYGTWVDDPAIGWAWVPGYVWAPAWVVFRIGPDYIGWAPVSPGFTIGVSAGFGARAAGPFVFVAARDFLAPRVRTCVVRPSTSRLIVDRTTVVNTLVVEKNVVVNRGPDVRLVERASGRRVSAVPIDRVSGVAPGRGFTRDRIAAETRGAGRGLRAAEPVAASGPARARLEPPPREQVRRGRPAAPAPATPPPVAPQDDEKPKHQRRPGHHGRPTEHDHP